MQLDAGMLTPPSDRECLLRTSPNYPTNAHLCTCLLLSSSRTLRRISPDALGGHIAWCFENCFFRQVSGRSNL